MPMMGGHLGGLLPSTAKANAGLLTEDDLHHLVHWAVETCLPLLMPVDSGRQSFDLINEPFGDLIQLTLRYLEDTSPGAPRAMDEEERASYLWELEKSWFHQTLTTQIVGRGHIWAQTFRRARYLAWSYLILHSLEEAALKMDTAVKLGRLDRTLETLSFEGKKASTDVK